jgi:DNA polymerase III delta prime subunit
LKDVVGNVEIITTIKSMLSNPSNMLFKGVPGTGKTSTALAIANELDCDYKEINASDDRGIETVRTTIKNFAMENLK